MFHMYGVWNGIGPCSDQAVIQTKAPVLSGKPLHIFFAHTLGRTPGAQIDKPIHSATFLYAHFYIKILILLNIHVHAHAGCTGLYIHAPGSQNVHTGCMVHPKFLTLPRTKKEKRT